MDCCIAKCKMDGIVTQPMILMKAENEELDKSPEFFIICDSKALPVNGNASKALELLFRSILLFQCGLSFRAGLYLRFLGGRIRYERFGIAGTSAQKARSGYRISTNLAGKFLKMLSSVINIRKFTVLYKLAF